ncbi:Rad2 nuclease [Sticta canariensis]|nr:Rad2 nuclease [Sticta canariensis]
MGISGRLMRQSCVSTSLQLEGLLRLLKSIQKPCNIRKFAGLTIGIDAYGWLHRGTVACAVDIALGRPTTKFVDFCMHRLRMLLHFGVIPYVVFDGDYLPSKSSTEAKRATRREECRKLGLELHRLGRLTQANNELQKAVDVTPEMAGQFIEEIKKLGVRYLVAPYEADAQLAYLERKGIIDGILSEDSDLLVFGAKCLLTKLDQYGDCVEINRKDFTACREVSLVGWTDTEFRCMAILSGCDYLTNLNQMGLKTAYRLVRKYKTIERILQNVAFNNKHQIPAGYLDLFRKANLTFLHQRVFCPTLNNIVMMESLQSDQEPEDFTFIGSDMDQNTAIGVSRGDLNPMTKKPMILVSSTRRGTPKTPWGGMGKQSSTTFSELKGNKSIESFFKNQRTPLAELDPNAFTPSPGQQRLLEQNSTTWMSSPAPARLPLPRTNGSATAPGTRGISTKVVGTANENVKSETVSHSSKRRRLCSETYKGQDSTEDAVDAASDRSRYFTSSLPNLHSPSIKKNKGSRRVKDIEINVWSDDSVEDVMAGMPEISDSTDAKTKKGMNIFRDVVLEDSRSFSPVLVQGISTSPKDSQTSTVSNGPIDSNTSLSSATTSTTSTARSVAKTLSKNVKADLAALSDKFSYQPAVLESDLARSTLSRNKPRDTNGPISLVAKPPLGRQGSMTPLQRLEAGALNRSRSYSGHSSNSSSKLSANLSPTSSSEAPQILEIASSSIIHQEETTKLRGSEDLIVPDSEDNSSDDSVSRQEPDARERENPKLDIGHFAFTG